MGNSINVITTNDTLNFFKFKLDAGDMTPVGESYRIKITNPDEAEFVASLDETFFEYYNFKIPSSDTNVTHEQEYNYSAVDYELGISNETGLFSIYNNFNSDNAVEKSSIVNFEAGPIDNIGHYTNIISPAQNQNATELLVSQYSKSFPRGFSIDIPNTDINQLHQYDLLAERNLFESFTESLSLAFFQKQEIESINGPVEISSVEFRKIYDKMKLEPEELEAKIFSESQLEDVHPTVWVELEYVSSEPIDQHQSYFYLHKILGEPEHAEYHDLVCYEVTKSKFGSPVQTFFITPEQKKFYDTQIFSRTDYDYEIYAHVIIIATAIKFEVTIAEAEEAPEAIVTPVYDHQSLVIRLPISVASITTKTFAPTTPEVTFINQSNESNNFKIFLEQSFIDHRAIFQPLIDSDLEVDKFTFKGIGNDSLKTVFKIGEAGVTYQIYKLNQKPTSFLDFENALAVTSDTNSNNAVVNMMLTPNRKFYLLFRTVNAFGIPSNPSPVYEVELIKDSDETRIMYKTINFKHKVDRSFISFGRFIKIYPAFEQLSINRWGGPDGEPPPDPNSSEIFTPYGIYYVGDADVPIWGRKMKFRIRSKNTGKIIDINVDFVINNKQSEQEFNTTNDEDLR